MRSVHKPGYVPATRIRTGNRTFTLDGMSG